MKAGLKKASVMETKRNPNAFTDFKFRRDALQGIFFKFLFFFFHFMEYSNYYIIFIINISNLIMRCIDFIPCFALYNSNASVVLRMAELFWYTWIQNNPKCLNWNSNDSYILFDHLQVCFSTSHNHSVTLSLYLSIYLSPSHFLFFSLTLSLSLSLSFFRSVSLLSGLERCAGEVVTDMLTIIENCEPDEAQMRLVMRGTYMSSPTHIIIWYHFLLL